MQSVANPTAQLTRAGGSTQGLSCANQFKKSKTSSPRMGISSQQTAGPFRTNMCMKVAESAARVYCSESLAYFNRTLPSFQARRGVVPLGACGGVQGYRRGRRAHRQFLPLLVRCALDVACIAPSGDSHHVPRNAKGQAGKTSDRIRRC